MASTPAATADTQPNIPVSTAESPVSRTAPAAARAAQKPRVPASAEISAPRTIRTIAPNRESMLYFVPEPSKARIRERAYFLYLARGGAAGCAASDWLEAERQLIQEARDATVRGRRA